MQGFNPEVFIWAREGAGLDVAGAAEALHIKSGTLEALEAGASEPSRPLLLRMTKVYRRPLLAFYLPSPPKKGDRGQDFRTVIPDQARDAEVEIDALLRDVKARQSLVRSVLEDDDDAHPIEFVGCATMDWDVEVLSKKIAGRLKFDREVFRRQPTSERAFAYLRNCVEDAGVFVLLIGNLGSYHSAIPVEAFRGFAIADPLAPFVVVNDQDARTAWSFTLLHELAHLWLGQSGVSGASGENQTEQFCNAVAAEILIPSYELTAIRVEVGTFAEQIEVISKLADQWNVSRQMLAYGLLRAGRLKHAQWQSIDGRFREMWRAERAREKEQSRLSKSGPTYYVLRRHRLGAAMLGFAKHALSTGSLTPAKAAQVLGVNPRSVLPLLGTAP